MLHRVHEASLNHRDEESKHRQEQRNTIDCASFNGEPYFRNVVFVIHRVWAFDFQS